MRKKHHCPNCGSAIALPSKIRHMKCSQCSMELILESNSKLFLAKPSSTYLDLNELSHPPNLALDGNSLSSPKLSESRQKRTTLLIQERVAQERKRRQEGVLFGYVGIVIGLICLSLLGIQIYTSGANEFNIAGVCLAIILVIGETWVVLWFRKAFPLDK